MRKVVVEGFWDEEAKVWVASSKNVPGLITEAKSIPALRRKLKTLIPELLDANGYEDGDSVPFRLNTRAQYEDVAHSKAA
jgi:predicted RNase H-like HicB family nuclease